MLTDGGGFASAARRPVEGADKVAKFLLGLARRAPDFTATPAWVNGAASLVVDVPGDVPSVLTATAQGGRVTHIFAMRNPHKLSRIDTETPLAR